LLAPYLRFLAAHPGALAFGFMLTFFSAFGQTFFIALFNREIRELYGLTSGEFGTLYAVANIIGAALIVRAGRQIDHWPLTWFVGSVVVGLTIAAALMASLPPGHIWVLFIAIVLLRLVRPGADVPHRCHHGGAHLSRPARPGAVNGVDGVCGRRGGVADHRGATGVDRGMAADLGRRGRRAGGSGPAAGGRLAHRCYPSRPGGGALAAAPANDRSRAQVLRDPAFYLLLPAMVAPAFVNTGVFFHQVLISEAKGWTLMAFASAFTTYALTTMVMMLVGGRIIDRTSARRC
jgi:hypothetical protein